MAVVLLLWDSYEFDEDDPARTHLSESATTGAR